MPTGVKEQFYDQAWQDWNDMIRLSPAPRIRRRMVLNRLRALRPDSLLDVGCGNGAFLQETRTALGGCVRLAGADVSPAVIAANAQRLPEIGFHVLDLDAGSLRDRFHTVVAMEVLEHCTDFQAALCNLATMAQRHLIVTVPCGPLFPIDRMVGHTRHFSPEDLRAALPAAGLEEVRIVRWGWPFFNLYKHAINLSPERMSENFMSDKPYGPTQRLVAQAAYAAFRLSLPVWGYQLVAVLAKRGAA